MLSVQFFVLGTTDMGRAVDFWTQALGYVVSKGGRIPGLARELHRSRFVCATVITPSWTV